MITAEMGPDGEFRIIMKHALNLTVNLAAVAASVYAALII
jgi:hypothetical protein